jgi:hypothetical protein
MTCGHARQAWLLAFSVVYLDGVCSVRARLRVDVPAMKV